MNLDQMRAAERWIAWVRLGAFGFALFQLGVLPDDYPSRRYEVAAWTTTIALGAGAVLLLWLARRNLGARTLRVVAFAALAFDTAIVSSYVLVYSFEPAAPIRQALFIPLAEAALRYGLVGGVGLALAVAPVNAVFEWLRSDRFDQAYDVDAVTFPVGVSVITGLVIGWLVERLRGQTEVAEARASEAEGLRDELGRRADMLEAANRCARALSSSLELDQAFAAFIRELSGLMPYDRVAIVMSENGSARVMAATGAGADRVFPAGSIRPVPGSALEHVLRDAQTLYRANMLDRRYEEENDMLALGLRSRVVAPLLVGPRAIGMVSLVRTRTDAFSAEEVELVSLLGRFLGSAVQNIRAYEAERATVEELRRLSALRADFVSLVSHELRSPMASVIGSAQTLRQRWRELSPDQRESFLGLISHETERLATLIEDVLDTSRIEAGTFSYTFTDVDVADLVRDSVAAAEQGQDEVPVRGSVNGKLPPLRGDRERLRQVLANLIDNAVKYSPAGEPVEVEARLHGETLRIVVRDRGPGIAPEDRKLIFEKFGRGKSGNAKPGTGLGLFIARSIVEAHGGSVDVRSAPGEGATFELAIPLD